MDSNSWYICFDNHYPPEGAALEILKFVLFFFYWEFHLLDLILFHVKPKGIGMEILCLKQAYWCKILILIHALLPFFITMCHAFILFTNNFQSWGSWGKLMCKAPCQSEGTVTKTQYQWKWLPSVRWTKLASEAYLVFASFIFQMLP